MHQPRTVFACVFWFFSPLCRQNGKKKLPSFFGIEGGQERDTTTDKILQYIPGKASTNTSNPPPHCSRRFFPPTPRTALCIRGMMGLDLGVAAGLSQGDGGHVCSRVPMQVLRAPAISQNVRRGGRVVLRAKQAAWWEYLTPPTHPLLVVLLFLGSLWRKGKLERAFKGKMIHSHAGMRRSRQCISNKPWEGNQGGHVCPRHVPALWPYGPFPSTAQGKQR